MTLRMPDEEIVLICARVADLRNPTAGSVIRECTRCKQLVWVSSESIERVIVVHLVAPTLICLQCAHPDIEREGLAKIIAETERLGIER